MKLCVPCPLQVKGKGIKGVGEVADKQAYTVHTINTSSSQQQNFVARYFSSCVGNVLGLCSICVCIPSVHMVVT
jgi:hypothetical protein